MSYYLPFLQVQSDRKKEIKRKIRLILCENRGGTFRVECSIPLWKGEREGIRNILMESNLPYQLCHLGLSYLTFYYYILQNSFLLFF